MSDKHIHLLSERVTNKIAAGEVVERPASVLKELVENSLDAGADQVDVEVVEGGRRVLTVADNGRGMNADDALMSIQRYATSKIGDVEDIESISTMGFRGEALAAISSVSRFKLTTRSEESDAGTEVVVSGGKVQDVQSAGCPLGTKIEVRNMFFNVPARRKFMRTARTEFTHVKQKFLVYALANPAVGMTLKSDERTVFSLTPGDGLEDRIGAIYGESLSSALRTVEHSYAGVNIRGYVALPRVARSDRSDQYIFINNRPATAPVLAYAIREGYHTLMPSGRHPVLFLFLQLDPGLVDVNVHPTKREVRFRRSNDVRDAMIGAIRKALETPSSAAPVPPREDGGHAAFGGLDKRSSIDIQDLPKAPVFQYPRMSMLDERPLQDRSATEISQGEGELETGADTPWARCRVLGQIGGLFVVLETEDGMVLMDPHAAHERVMFDKFMDQVVNGKVHSQGLLAPETLDMSPDNAAVIRKNEEVLKDLGFGISSFGGDSFIVDSVPSCIGEVSIAEVVENLAKAADRGGKASSAEHGARERIAMAACKAAVKAGDMLSLSEIEKLVVDLALTKMPYTCPHGRPTMIFMSFKELQKKFGRIN